MIKFLLKWLVNGAVVVSLLLYYSDASFWGAIIAATALTVIAYLLGDQLILRMTNNIVATVADFLLAAIFLGALSYILDWQLSMGETLLIAFMVGIAEWVLHRFVFHEELRLA